jgi:hypothetical protein
MLDNCLNNGKLSSMSENIDSDILEIEIEPNALNYLKKYGNVFILTDVQNPQYSYYKIKGYDDNANIVIKFTEFVEICKTYPDTETNMNNPKTEYVTKTFDVTSPASKKHYDLAFYVAKSGFATVNDWLKTVKSENEIPECSTGHNKTFYLYHIQTIQPTA